MFVATERERRLLQLFPNGVPRLWCPTLTYFQSARTPDLPRIAQHLVRLASDVRGILVPGSTGEGWEMSDTETRDLLVGTLNAAHSAGMRVLVGLLKTETDAMLTALDGLAPLIDHPAFVGITVCPPRGAELTQTQLAGALSQILERDLPTAIYQLPQITQNELSPETVAALAYTFPNFILFKDTSGEDRVAASGLDLAGLFLLRGSERFGYAPWYKKAGGPYDGFLLSTANCFAPQLGQMLDLLEVGQHAQADVLSRKIEAVVMEVFDIVKDFPHGNAFTNANKAIDHVLTFGPLVSQTAPPMLYNGHRLDTELIARVQSTINAADFLPTARA